MRKGQQQELGFVKHVSKSGLRFAFRAVEHV